MYRSHCMSIGDYLQCTFYFSRFVTDLIPIILSIGRSYPCHFQLRCGRTSALYYKKWGPGKMCVMVTSQKGRRQNLNPEPKINLNHANLKPPNSWAVVSQESARFTQEFYSNQSFTFRCRSCAQTDFVAVAAARGRGRVAGGCLRYGNWLVGVTMMGAAGRWLVAASHCTSAAHAGEHVLIRTNLVGTMCWPAGGGWVCGDTCLSRSCLRERFCSQLRVCVRMRGTTTRSRWPLAS